MGGGAASSMGAGANIEDLDFDSVQRDNAEIERRAQEVIDRCWQLGAANPILSIHDVGAGGLSNALPELAHGAGRGARIELRAIPSEDSGMSPREIWCNEAQERYVLGDCRRKIWSLFSKICERERCPFAVVGSATDDGRLVVEDSLLKKKPVDVELAMILGKPPKMLRDVKRIAPACSPLSLKDITIAAAVSRVLAHPAVANKTFLVSIGDRTVGGLCARDPFVGPWQVPVADCAVTLLDYEGYAGEAFAVGERTPLALIDAPASGRMAVGEALTNLASSVTDLSKIKLSANWMAAAGYPGEDAALFDTVRAVALELCPALGISIPVGKDSLSMRTAWGDKEVVAPMSLVVSAFAPVADARAALTPQLRTDAGETELVLVDLGRGKNRLGGSILAQAFSQLGDDCPDLDDPALLKGFVAFIGKNRDLLLAYHDRSDGGLFATACEMAFAGHCGVTLSLDPIAFDPAADDVDAFKRDAEEQLAGRAKDLALHALFAEELGAVLQIRAADRARVMAALRAAGLGEHAHLIGSLNARDELRITRNNRVVFVAKRDHLQRTWSETTLHMQALRDNPACAREEYDRIIEPNDPGLGVSLTFTPSTAFVSSGSRPRIAILREQGVNGQVEMAAAFDRAGFESVDVHMTDLIAGRASLRGLQGLRRRRRLLLRRRAGRRAGLGKDHPVQPAGARGVRALLRTQGHLRARRVQRLPDDGRAARDRARRLGLAALRAQSLRAVRGAPGDGRDHREPLDPLRRHGRQPHSHRHRARRRQAGVQRRKGCVARPGRDALRKQSRRADRDLSLQPERFAGRDYRPHHAGWALHHRHAAPRARVPQRADVLVTARLGRGLAVDAALPQRAQVDRMKPRVKQGRLARS